MLFRAVRWPQHSESGEQIKRSSTSLGGQSNEQMAPTFFWNNHQEIGFFGGNPGKKSDYRPVLISFAHYNSRLKIENTIERDLANAVFAWSNACKKESRLVLFSRRNRREELCAK